MFCCVKERWSGGLQQFVIHFLNEFVVIIFRYFLCNTFSKTKKKKVILLVLV